MLHCTLTKTLSFHPLFPSNVSVLIPAGDSSRPSTLGVATCFKGTQPMFFINNNNNEMALEHECKCIFSPSSSSHIGRHLNAFPIELCWRVRISWLLGVAQTKVPQPQNLQQIAGRIAFVVLPRVMIIFHLLLLRHMGAIREPPSSSLLGSNSTYIRQVSTIYHSSKLALQSTYMTRGYERMRVITEIHQDTEAHTRTPLVRPDGTGSRSASWRYLYLTCLHLCLWKPATGHTHTPSLLA